MANIHADLIDEYSQDWKESTTPWEGWEYQPPFDDKNWFSCNNHPQWSAFYKYRRKPKTININGFEVPEPVREPLKIGQRYFSASGFKSNSLYSLYEWEGDETDIILLERGLIHLDAESAILHAKALLSFTQIKDYEV